MKKTLELDDATARRLYPTASAEFKELLEQNFGKEFFSQKIRDRIHNYQDVCNELGVNSDDNKIKVEVEGFDDREIKSVKAFIKKMRVSKCYREGKVPKKGDSRYYYWHRLSPSAPSGLVFRSTYCRNGDVDANSASHLCLLNREDAQDMAEKFKDIDSDFYDLK